MTAGDHSSWASSNFGTTSCTFRYHFVRAADGIEIATIDHVTVCSTLDTMQKTPLPADCRALLEFHLSS